MHAFVAYAPQTMFDLGLEQCKVCVHARPGMTKLDRLARLNATGQRTRAAVISPFFVSPSFSLS